MTDTEMQRMILNKLMFVNGLKYSELHKEFENHDLFNYHLRELVKKEYVEKSGDVYTLTMKGKQAVALMEEDGQYQKQFKVGMFMNVVRQVDGVWEMLLYKRLKHPHYGYIGSISGKLRFGDSFEENVKRELMDEVKVKALSCSTLGVIRQVFRDEKGDVVGDGVFFVTVIDKWEGEPELKSVEGEYFWCEIDKILSLENIFRDFFEKGLPYLKRYLADPKGYSPYVSEIMDEGSKF